MKKHFLSTVAILALGITTTAKADLPSDNIIRGTLQNIDTSIDVAVKTAEQLYVENAGVALGGAVSLSADHPYFQHFAVSTSYDIEMQFKSAQKVKVDATAGTEGNAGTTAGLYDKKILLVPVYTSGDSVITAWECLTDADSYYSVNIQGQAAPTDGAKSFITRYTDNPYLALCTYVESTNALFTVPE